VPSRRDLFVVDPNEFVARRNELARELRARGDKSEAAEIKTLRRPTVAVWALNQVARDHGDLVQQLVDAANEAEAAQRALLEGTEADHFRAALGRRRQAMSAVSDAAFTLIDRSGRARDTYARDVENTLNAVVASPELLDELARSELAAVPSDGSSPGEMFAGITPVESNPSAPSRAATRRPSAQLAKAREQLDRHRAELGESERELGAADEAVTATQAQLAEANKEVERTLARREQARRHRDRAQEEVARSQRRVEGLES
jgi:flagellin-like hook-associated protein FlgL